MKLQRQQVKVCITFEFNTTVEDADTQFESASNIIQNTLGNALYQLDEKYGIHTTDQEWK